LCSENVCGNDKDKDSQNGGEDSVESLLARGRALELSHNHSEAIDLYLQLDSSLLADFDKLQEVGHSMTVRIV
jgi:hypothetical protein